MTIERPEDVEHVLAATSGLLAEQGIVGERLLKVAAAGVVVQVWRDTIEYLHRRFTDAEMAHMSAVTCRDILPYFSEAGADADAVIGVLRDPDRPLLAGRKAQAVIGTHWRKFRTEVTAAPAAFGCT